MKKRSEINEKYKWNLEDYFKSSEDWEICFNKYVALSKTIKDFEKKLTNKQSILDCFKLLDKIDSFAEPLYIYANSINDLNVTNGENQSRLNKIESALSEQSILSSFVTPELTNLSSEFLCELKNDKDFEEYSKILEDVLREKEHVLDKDCEKLLSSVSLFSSSFDNNFSNFENGDLKFDKVKNSKGKLLLMNESLASLYLRDKDAVLRENAYVELNSAFGRYKNFLTSNYLGSVKKDVFYAKNRRFSSSLERALFNEEIDRDVYDNLIKQVSDNLSLEYKYFELRKKLLKIKHFKTSDVYYNPLKNEKRYSYEQGFDIVCGALNLLGDDYVEKLKELNSNRKIDVFPTENKRNGAYETVAYGFSPIVLTNFNGNFDDISTLAHELGHAMHSYYSNLSQPRFKASYPIFLAEIASTVNETILNDYMLKNAQTNNEKLFYISEFLSRAHATIFRQTMFAEFEELTHNLIENNLPVSSDILCDKYKDLVKKYFGKKVKVLDAVKYEWSRIPHFYTAFYVYKYATGLISAINIVENLKNGVITVDDYKRFLSSGCTSDPISLLKIVNVDLKQKKSFDIAFSVIDRYLKDMKSFL